MTASTPFRSRSACQSATPSPPMNLTARSASRSSSEPGKVTTPTRGGRSVIEPRSSARLLGAQDLEVLDHRVREEALRHLLDLRLGGRLALGLDRELDVAPDPNAAHVGPPHRRQRTLDGLPLWVQETGLELDEHLERQVHAWSRRGRLRSAASAPASSPDVTPLRCR